MDLVYIMVGGLGILGFALYTIITRSSGYRAILSKLENENNMLELRLGSLEEERQQVQATVADLKGQVEAREEELERQHRAASEAALRQQQAENETFFEYLIRNGVIMKEHLEKVHTYKDKNNSLNSAEELLVILGFLEAAEMQKAQAEYVAGRTPHD